MADYDLTSYGRMLTHEARIAAYAHAIRAAVRPGDVVLELGTGTGLMAMLACQCGAKRVYALEPLAGIIVAQKAARDNGFADRIVFLRALSTQIELPERCDVLISDMRGAVPCFSTHFVDLMDARTRLLKPDARWICATDTLHAAPIDLPDPVTHVAAAWEGARWGLDLSSALPYARNQISRHPVAPADLLAAPQTWGRIDYPNLQSPHVRGRAAFTATRAGTAHGFSIWFSAELFGGARFDNSPASPLGVYVPLLLPWERPVPLQPGDTIEATIEAVFSGQVYWWNWNTVVRRAGVATPLAAFQQSSFKGQLLDRSDVAASATSHVIRPTPATEEMKFVLNRLDGRATQGEIATALRAEFPGRFANDEAALARVGQIRAGLD